MPEYKGEKMTLEGGMRRTTKEKIKLAAVAVIIAMILNWWRVK